MYPGDVQKISTIGKPPENMFCAFAHLKNVVALPFVECSDLETAALPDKRGAEAQDVCDFIVDFMRDVLTRTMYGAL
ncbi:hypothetical protein C0995_014320 [Termitomyces sp. Mi166|nr:hypothetical protein C0995_014320 [Termitomyces sp. Mi166\